MNGFDSIIIQSLRSVVTFSSPGWTMLEPIVLYLYKVRGPGLHQGLLFCMERNVCCRMCPLCTFWLTLVLAKDLVGIGLPTVCRDSGLFPRFCPQPFKIVDSVLLSSLSRPEQKRISPEECNHIMAHNMQKSIPQKRPQNMVDATFYTIVTLCSSGPPSLKLRTGAEHLRVRTRSR